MPFWVARHAGGVEIGLLVTDGATHGGEAMIVRAALDRGLMEPALLALSRVVARRMAVHAARMSQHLAEFGMPRTVPTCRLFWQGFPARRACPVARPKLRAR